MFSSQNKMKKILIIGTGGTIASTKSDLIRLDNPFKIIDYIDADDIELDCTSPFSVLSENISVDCWHLLIDTIENASGYDAFIVLHGSDTLAYTGAILANMFPTKSIVLVASNKPIEDKDANGIKNFNNALEHIKNNNSGVFISYDKIMRASQVVSADSSDSFIEAGEPLEPIDNPRLNDKKILVIKPYVNIDYSFFNIDEVDIVLHEMYHSATAPENVLDFIDRCKARGTEFYFVTPKASAEYESAEGFSEIIFNSTLENAYARLMLK